MIAVADLNLQNLYVNANGLEEFFLDKPNCIHFVTYYTFEMVFWVFDMIH